MSADAHSQNTEQAIAGVRQLLHALVPGVQGFCFYDPARSRCWSSLDDNDEPDRFVAGLPGEFVNGNGHGQSWHELRLESGTTMLAVPVRDKSDAVSGVLVAVLTQTGETPALESETSAASLSQALELIAENCALLGRIAVLESDYDELEKELSLAYEVDAKTHTTARSHSGLAQLVGQSGRFLGIAYSVLLMPSKRIRISATHSSWKNVNRKVLDRYLIDHMLPKLDGKRTPTIFEIPPVEGSNSEADQGYQTLLCPLVDRHGNVDGVLAQLGRVSKQPFTNSHRRFMAHIQRKVEYVIERSFDPMTGLMNRSGFEAQLQESWKSLTSVRDSHQLIYMDLDNLQLVNDTFGRPAGDAVIKRFARMIEDDLPKSAVVSCLAGDDFCVLLTHADEDQALDFARRIRARSDMLRYLKGDKSLQVTFSIGIAECSHRMGDPGRALKTARMACQSAKDHGRDRIEVYDEHNQSMIRRHDDIQLVAQIQQTLDADGFELLAQPIESLDGNMDRPRFEILLRMVDSDGKNVSRLALFSAAERYQIMPQIDRWVVSTTTAMLAKHLTAVHNHNAVFSINLSGQSLSDDDILTYIETEMREAGVPASALGFEVTESAAVSNLKNAQQLIDALRRRGCKIALDDFGAGLSSFAYLKNFHVDTLKIDGSFIRDIAENRISESMVAAITQVAKVMGLETVAEYVENEATRKRIGEIGVNFAQGHAIGRPQSLESVLEALGKRPLYSMA